MPPPTYRLSVSFVMVNQRTSLPLVETGRERRIEVTQELLSSSVSPEDVFYALVHEGAEKLWPDLKKLVSSNESAPKPEPAAGP